MRALDGFPGRICLCRPFFLPLRLDATLRGMPSVSGLSSLESVITDPQQIVSRQRADVRSLSLEALYSTRAIGGASWSPDGRQIIFVSNISGRYNLWRVAADTQRAESGPAWPVQLTFSSQRQFHPAWSPDGRWIAFMSDFDGNEQWDVFVVSAETGEVVNLTSTPEIAEENPVWSPDGGRLAFIAKPKSGSTFEIEVIDLATRERQPVTQNTPKEWGNFGPVWSPDGTRIAFTRSHATGRDSSVYLLDLSTGEARNLTPHEGEQNWAVADWSADGSTLLINSDAGNGYDNVALLDLSSGQVEWLTQEKWEIGAGEFSPDGQRLTWTANIDGNFEIFLFDRRSGKAERLPLPKGVNAPAGTPTAFTADGARLLFSHNGPESPTDLWVYEFAGGRSYPLTQALVGGLRRDDMVEPFLVHYPSRDGRWQISAWVYVPWNLERRPESPAVVYVHGGPASQSINSFHRLAQYLANRGYLVIAPNYRGSTGYGKEFHDANRFDLGGGDLEDVLAAADFIEQTGYVDAGKLVICGGSYGGYMTMLGVTKAAERWAAGVAIVPFVNWFTELENEDPLLQQYDLATMGDPVKDAERFRDRSPIFFVDQIQAPVLLLAGGNDPRCPRSETEQVAEAVTRHGGIAEVKIYEDEGHGFARIENMIDAYSRVATFLEKYVPPAQ